MDEKNNSTSRMDRKREATSRRIIAAALELIDRHGYEAVTMEQIAEQADIAKGTLYHYYPVKEAVIADHIERLSVEKNTERIERMKLLPDTRARIAASLTELMAAVEQQRVLFEKYFTYRVRQMVSLERKPNRPVGVHALEAEIIHIGQQSGEIRTDISQEIIEGLYEFLFITVVQQYFNHPDTFDKDRVIAECVELFMNGVKK